MVDATLYFEGERGPSIPDPARRQETASSGRTDEIGGVRDADGGLEGVANPSALFLAERRGNISGSCVFAGVEGTRPMLVEIQALVSPNASGGCAAARG